MFRKTAALVFLAAVTMGTGACSAEREIGANSQIEIRPGDTVEVVAEWVKFRLGRKVIATIEKGTRLQVKWVEDGWIGGYLSINGNERGGWLRREDVVRTKAAPPAKPAPPSPISEPQPAAKEITTPELQPTAEKTAKPQLELAAETITSPKPQPPSPKGSTAKETTVRNFGFSRVASNALMSNVPFTIDVLMASSVTDLAEIKPTDRIGTLILVGKGLSNNALRNLRGRSVRALNIDGARITNSGLPYLAELSDLRVLRLWSADLNDSALARIANLGNLESLDLEGANIRGEGLKYLKSLGKLRALVLGPSVEDAGLKYLQDVPALEELDLRPCRHITDAGLADLRHVTSLKRVALPPQITVEAKRSLRKKLPECEFYR